MLLWSYAVVVCVGPGFGQGLRIFTSDPVSHADERATAANVVIVDFDHLVFIAFDRLPAPDTVAAQGYRCPAIQRAPVFPDTIR